MYFDTEAGRLFRLSFCNNVTLDDVLPNSRATINYTHITRGVMHSCQRPAMLPPQPPRRVLFGDTIATPTRPTFLVYIAAMCGYGKPAAATPKVSGRAKHGLTVFWVPRAA